MNQQPKKMVPIAAKQATAHILGCIACSTAHHRQCPSCWNHARRHGCLLVGREDGRPRQAGQDLGQLRHDHRSQPRHQEDQGQAPVGGKEAHTFR